MQYSPDPTENRMGVLIFFMWVLVCTFFTAHSYGLGA